MTKLEELKLELQRRNLRYVGTRGDVRAPFVMVGEAPGADEDQAGVPFVGGAGKELDRMLSDAGVPSHLCWFTNPYKTRPPDNKLDRLHELGVDEKMFIDQFLEELTLNKPTFIVALGATPLGILCPFTRSVKKPYRAEISKYQGSLLTSPLLPWEHYVIPAYHPAYILRSWSDRVESVLCLAKAAEEHVYWRQHGTLQPLPTRKLIDSPTYDEAYEFLTMCLATPESQRISIDIENIGVFKGKYKTPQRNRLPYVVGFAPSPWLAMSVGLSEYEQNQTTELWRLIDAILCSKRQIGQNYYTHDAPWLRYIGFNPDIRLVSDTLVRHHVLWPELSHKLEFQTMQYTREPYYKNEGHNWSVKEKAKLKRYNCKDCCVTYEVWEKQEEEFNERA